MSTLYQYKAGMPQLVAAGLSQNWLLKECGHHHWTALARLLGLNGPDFHDLDGSPVYASFLMVKLNNLNLENIVNNAAFSLSCNIDAISRNRFLSVHHLRMQDKDIGQIIMVSTLVRHQNLSDNLTLTAAKLAFNGEIATIPDKWQRLIKDSRQLRLDALPSEWQFADKSEIKPDTYSYFPVPSLDFNGAGLLYFASFQAIAEVAEWHWDCIEEQWPIAHRHISYYGNLNVGDRLNIVCRNITLNDQSLRIWLSFYRNSDQIKIGDVLTHRIKVSHD